MTTLTVYSSTADGYIASEGTSYSLAANGTGDTFAALDTMLGGNLGQWTSSGPRYYFWESFIQFDTSSIPDSAGITSATLYIYGSDDGSTTDFTIEARLHDWGASLTTADFVTGANLSSKTLLASFNTSGFSTSGYNEFTENGSNLRNNINKTGTTYIILCSAEQTNESPPPTDTSEYVGIWLSDQTGTSNDPKFVITYSTAYTQSISGTMGGLTGALSAGHVYTKAISGAISSIVSTLTRTVNKATSGEFSATGVISKFTTKTFAGVSGTLSGSMTYVRVILHQISGTMGSLSGTVSDLQTGFGVNLTGAIESVSGSISRSVRKSVSGAFTATGKVFKMNTFRSAIIKAGTVVRKTIQSGRDY